MPPSFSSGVLRTRCLIAFLLLAAVSGPQLSPAAEQATSEIVQLPAFLVEETGIAKPEPHWYYAELPGLVVLSCLSERDTKAFLRVISDQLVLYSWILPPELQPAAAGPLGVILDARRLTSLRLPLSSMENSPSRTGRGRTLGGGFARWDFAANYHQSRRALPAVGAFMVATASAAQISQRPGWTHVGDIAVRGTMNATFARDGVTIYQPAHSLAKKNLPLPSLAAVFAQPAPPDEGTPPSASHDELKTWFGRWAFFADEGRHRQAWWNFARGTATRPEMSDEVAQRYFGMRLSELDASVGQFRKTSQSRRRLQLKQTSATQPATVAAPVVLRDAPAAEIARLLTQWALLAWRNGPDLRVPLRDAAHRLLDRGRKNAPQDPALTALRGLVELMDGNATEARKLLESVATTPELSHAARFELAKLRHAEAVAQAGAASEKFTTAQAGAILEPLTPFFLTTPNSADVLLLIVET